MLQSMFRLIYVLLICAFLVLKYIDISLPNHYFHLYAIIGIISKMIYGLQQWRQTGGDGGSQPPLNFGWGC